MMENVTHSDTNDARSKTVPTKITIDTCGQPDFFLKKDFVTKKPDVKTDKVVFTAGCNIKRKNLDEFKHLRRVSPWITFFTLGNPFPKKV